MRLQTTKGSKRLPLFPVIFAHSSFPSKWLEKRTKALLAINHIVVIDRFAFTIRSLVHVEHDEAHRPFVSDRIYKFMLELIRPSLRTLVIGLHVDAPPLVLIMPYHLIQLETANPPEVVESRVRRRYGFLAWVRLPNVGSERRPPLRDGICEQSALDSFVLSCHQGTPISSQRQLDLIHDSRIALRGFAPCCEMISTPFRSRVLYMSRSDIGHLVGATQGREDFAGNVAFEQRMTSVLLIPSRPAIHVLSCSEVMAEPDQNDAIKSYVGLTVATPVPGAGWSCPRRPAPDSLRTERRRPVNAPRVTAGRDQQSSRSVRSYSEDADEGRGCRPGEPFQLGPQIADLLVELRLRVYLAAAVGSSRRPGRKLLHRAAGQWPSDPPALAVWPGP